MNILLVGAESAAIQVLRGLAETPHRVVAVLADESPAGAGASLADVAEGIGLDVLEARRIRDPAFAGWMRERGVDLLLNVHSLSIIPGEVVEAPRIGSFNLHPGPLPRYAGLNVVSWAIYRGEAAHGVTLHWMDAGIDTGRIAYRAEFPIEDRDTGLSLFTKCVRHGVPLVFELLAAAERDPPAIPAVRQGGERVLYRRSDVPQDGRLEWWRPARQVHDFVRACDFGPFPSPWGRPRTALGDRELGVVRTARTGLPCQSPPGTVGRSADGGAMVATGDEWLVVRQVDLGDRTAPADVLLSPGARLDPGPPPRTRDSHLAPVS
jgi:methionyl-tRNA formyltransferase